MPVRPISPGRKGGRARFLPRAHGPEPAASERFLEWGGRILGGDLGTSMQRERTITEIVGWRLRNTLVLAAVAALIGIPLAILLGVMAGLRRDGPLDLLISSTAIVAMTIPEFISATLLILIFAVSLGWTAGVVTIGYKAPISISLRFRCCRQPPSP